MSTFAPSLIDSPKIRNKRKNIKQSAYLLVVRGVISEPYPSEVRVTRLNQKQLTTSLNSSCPISSTHSLEYTRQEKRTMMKMMTNEHVRRSGALVITYNSIIFN